MPGLVGEAFSFDGVNDYVNIPNSENLDSFGQSTIEGWINLNSTVGAQAIISKVPMGNYYLLVYRERLSFENNNVGMGVFPGGTRLEERTWVHVAATWDGDESTLFVNGVPDAVGTVDWFGSANARPVRIGQRGADDEFFGGLIDEISIYDRALSEDEIGAIVDAGSAGKCTGPANVTVAIDVKPDSDINSVNCRNGMGVVTVAILTDQEFDTTWVDHSKVSLDGASETHVDKKGGTLRRHEEDVDDDGDTDLVFHFRLGDTGLTCDSTETTLMGETFDGTPFSGVDSVRMVPAGPKVIKVGR